MVDIQFLGLLNATLQAATLLFIASLGELITEKSGILNLGVEGMISVGAVAGFMTAVNTNNIFLAIIVGVLSSAIFASIHAIVTVTLKQDQTVSGLILTILGLAVSSLLGKNYVGKKLETKLESLFSIEYKINQILLKNDDVEEALKKAEVIITEIENGLSFKEAQKNYSSLFDNDQNGSLGWRTRSQIPTLFSKKIIKVGFD